MKVAIAFPPDKADRNKYKRHSRSVPMAEFDSYPMIAASAATLLKAKGFEVLWADAASEGWSYRRFINYLKREQPDLVAIQTSTAKVKRDWEAVDDLKSAFEGSWFANIVMMGDHVTALPEETFKNCDADFIIAGGNFDFLLLNLCSQLSLDGPDHSFGLESGIWYRHGEQVKNTGPFRLTHDLNRLPLIDRELTKWWLYSYEEEKVKKPATYTMVARDCGWGQSAFSPTSVLYPDKRFRTRSPESLLNEIGLLINKYGVGEVFDLSNTFPSGSWLRSFCQGMIQRGYNERVSVGCRMRLGALATDDWQLMRNAGFHKIFFTLESASNKTLRKIGSAANGRHLFENVRSAKKAGLETHVSVMLGFPWETANEMIGTVEYVKRFLRDGWVDGLEGKIVTPYPGTGFFSECRQRGWLKTEDWNLYDRHQVLVKSSLSEETVHAMTESLNRKPLTPKVVYQKLAAIGLKERISAFIKHNWLANKVMSFFIGDAVESENDDARKTEEEKSVGSGQNRKAS